MSTFSSMHDLPVEGAVFHVMSHDGKYGELDLCLDFDGAGPIRSLSLMHQNHRTCKEGEMLGPIS